LDILLVVPPAFFLIAFVFSMLGMGGSQLYVPILMWIGMDFKTEAVPLGMLLNLVNSGSAMVTYIRKGLVVWHVAVPFGLTMIAFAPLGTWLNIRLPAKPLLIVFAAMNALAAALMLSSWKPRRGRLSRRAVTAISLLSGSVLGTLAGLIGRGGGSFVVPTLYLGGLDPRAAAATSAFAVSASGLSSFTSHLVSAAAPRWGVWSTTAIAVLLGSHLGSRLMAEHLNPRMLRIVFGSVLLLVAGLILVKDVILG